MDSKKNISGKNRKRLRDRQAELEKEKLLDPEKWKERNRQKRVKALLTVLCGLVLTVLVIFACFEAVKAVGRSNLRSMAAQSVPQLVKEGEQEETDAAAREATDAEKADAGEEDWQEGWVKHEGTVYEYNQDIMTFLFMGIDKKNEVLQVAEGTDGGQADALFLLVLNPHDRSISVIGVNRNTMTDVDLYNDEGAYRTTVTAQIAVQHGFGNGLEESCEYQVEAVRRLFYQLPVHGYCAVNMDAIISLTDLVGGIELTALEDVKSKLPENYGSRIASEGEPVLLDGKKAYSYVSWRDINIAGSADARLKRQKQFLEEMIKKTKTRTASDLTLPVKLYNAVSKQMVTNVTVDEVAYLASTVSGYTFDSDRFYTLKGETVQGEQFEEFYVDEDALYEMILDIFYEPVEKE